MKLNIEVEISKHIWVYFVNDKFIWF